MATRICSRLRFADRGPKVDRLATVPNLTLLQEQAAPAMASCVSRPTLAMTAALGRTMRLPAGRKVRQRLPRATAGADLTVNATSRADCHGVSDSWTGLEFFATWLQLRPEQGA